MLAQDHDGDDENINKLTETEEASRGLGKYHGNKERDLACNGAAARNKERRSARDSDGVLR